MLSNSCFFLIAYLILYVLHRYQNPHKLWAQIAERLVILQGLTTVEKAHLRELTTLFLHQKGFVGAQLLQLTDFMCVVIAVQACLPVLKLGIGCLSGWKDIIVYPGSFFMYVASVPPIILNYKENNIYNLICLLV